MPLDTGNRLHWRPKTQKKQTAKRALAQSKTNVKLQNRGLVAFYNIQPGNEALTTPELGTEP